MAYFTNSLPWYHFRALNIYTMVCIGKIYLSVKRLGGYWDWFWEMSSVLCCACSRKEKQEKWPAEGREAATPLFIYFYQLPWSWWPYTLPQDDLIRKASELCSIQCLRDVVWFKLFFILEEHGCCVVWKNLCAKASGRNNVSCTVIVFWTIWLLKTSWHTRNYSSSSCPSFNLGWNISEQVC